MTTGKFRRRAGQPRGKDAARRRGFQLGRPALRHDERFDVGRNAPAVEGSFRRPGEAAARRRDPRHGRRHRRHRLPDGRRGARVTVADINPDMLEVGKERAGQRGSPASMEGRECGEPDLRRRGVRRLYDRVRDPQRDRHSRPRSRKRTACSSAAGGFSAWNFVERLAGILQARRSFAVERHPAHRQGRRR